MTAAFQLRQLRDRALSSFPTHLCWPAPSRSLPDRPPPASALDARDSCVRDHRGRILTVAAHSHFAQHAFRLRPAGSGPAPHVDPTSTFADSRSRLGCLAPCAVRSSYARQAQAAAVFRLDLQSPDTPEPARAAGRHSRPGCARGRCPGALVPREDGLTAQNYSCNAGVWTSIGAVADLFEAKPIYCAGKADKVRTLARQAGTFKPSALRDARSAMQRDPS